MSNSTPFIWNFWFFSFFRFSLIFVMLKMPFWNGHNFDSAWLRKMPYVSIDSEWPKIMFYIGPQLQHFPVEKIFKTKNHPTQVLNKNFKSDLCISLSYLIFKLGRSVWEFQKYNLRSISPRHFILQGGLMLMFIVWATFTASVVWSILYGHLRWKKYKTEIRFY